MYYNIVVTNISNTMEWQLIAHIGVDISYSITCLIRTSMFEWYSRGGGANLYDHLMSI